MLQERGVARRDWLTWLDRVPAFARMSPERIDEVVEWMLAQGVLFEEEGLLWFGREGEAAFGRSSQHDEGSGEVASGNFG